MDTFFTYTTITIFFSITSNTLWPTDVRGGFGRVEGSPRSARGSKTAFDCTREKRTRDK